MINDNFRNNTIIHIKIGGTISTLEWTHLFVEYWAYVTLWLLLFRLHSMKVFHIQLMKSDSCEWNVLYDEQIETI